MTSPVAIFCAASVSEAISAALIGSRFSRDRRVLLFDLRVNFDAAAITSRLEDLRGVGGWDEVVLMNSPAPELRGGRRQWQGRKAVRDALRKVFGARRFPPPSCVRIGFTVPHDYVRHVVGVFPDARRFYFPHSFDQPMLSQIRERPELLGPRRQRRGCSRQEMRWRLLDAAYRLRGAGRDGRLFEGVDQAFTYSPFAPPVPFERIPPDDLQAYFRRVAALPAIHQAIAAVRAVIAGPPAGILLLSELNDRADAGLNPDRGRAYAEVLRAVAAHTGLTRFLVKPHPRSDRETYRSFLDQVRSAAPDFSLVEWPESAGPLSVEILLSVAPVACVASLASCSAPPWATPGVRHYVSAAAGRIFDQGWRGPRTHTHCYERYARELAEEGIACDLAAPPEKRGHEPA